jgi:hypothetical protein
MEQSRKQEMKARDNEAKLQLQILKARQNAVIMHQRNLLRQNEINLNHEDENLSIKKFHQGHGAPTTAHVSVAEERCAVTLNSVSKKSEKIHQRQSS